MYIRTVNNCKFLRGPTKDLVMFRNSDRICHEIVRVLCCANNEILHVFTLNALNETQCTVSASDHENEAVPRVIAKEFHF